MPIHALCALATTNVSKFVLRNQPSGNTVWEKAMSYETKIWIARAGAAIAAIIVNVVYFYK